MLSPTGSEPWEGANKYENAKPGDQLQSCVTVTSREPKTVPLDGRSTVLTERRNAVPFASGAHR
jgi:hypothetical protein